MWAMSIGDGCACADTYLCMRVQCQWVNGIKSYRDDIDLPVHLPANLRWRPEENTDERIDSCSDYLLFGCKTKT